MATATIIRVWQDAQKTNLAAKVLENQRVDGVVVNTWVEYIGSVDNTTFNALPTAAAKKTALVTATKAVRDAQLGVTPTDIPAINGDVSV